MMTGVTWILTFICVAGCRLSSASPVLRSALVVQAGQNVSLTCNLTSSTETTWYLLRSDQLLPLLTVSSGKLGDVTVIGHSAGVSRFINEGDVERGPVALQIEELQEDDAGLYFCIGRCAGAVCVDRGHHVVVDGVDGESARQPCWILGICVLPASLLVLCFVFIVGFYLHSGKPAVCCCRDTSQRVTEEISLHYSSLRHPDKPRPSGRAGTGLVEENVTYSALTKNPKGSHDPR